MNKKISLRVIHTHNPPIDVVVKEDIPRLKTLLTDVGGQGILQLFDTEKDLPVWINMVNVARLEPSYEDENEDNNQRN